MTNSIEYSKLSSSQKEYRDFVINVANEIEKECNLNDLEQGLNAKYCSCIKDAYKAHSICEQNNYINKHTPNEIKRISTDLCSGEVGHNYTPSTHKLFSVNIGSKGVYYPLNNPPRCKLKLRERVFGMF
ncbi:MAG: hypothetical protein Ta2D_12090 [Rickettsiales bacterium]|nr:MAG: hypothetical protein Ta2D_12090 [Rickettsiales bacterium]